MATFQSQRNFQAINNFEHYVVYHNIIQHDCFENVLTGKTLSKRRQFLYWTETAIFAALLFKCVVFTFIHDEVLFETMGDSFHIIFNKANFFYALLVFVLSIGIIAKLFVFFGEMKSNSGLHCVFHLMLSLRFGHPFYQLNLHNWKKMNKHSNLYFSIITKTIGNSISNFITVSYFINSLANYMNNQQKFSIIIILLNSCHYTILTRYMLAITSSGSFIVFLPVTFLNYKFDELSKSLRLAIRWRNKNKISPIVNNYDQLTR